jgi:S1-C subfamily serine protease
VEKDVSRDPLAAQEMVQLSGQYGVPVIAVNGDVVVGFDRARLENLLARHGTPVKLGLSVADAAPTLARSGKPVVDGALVGKVREGSPAHLAGIRAGDIIVGIEGFPVRKAADLEQRLKVLGRGCTIRLTVLRHGEILEVEVSV